MQKFASTLHPSNYFILLQTLMLCCSLAIVVYLPWGILLKIILMTALLSYALWNVYIQRQWQAIGHDADGWYIVRNNEKIDIQLSGDSTLTSFVIILRFTLLEKRFKQTCLIFRDAIPLDYYRQLVVRMRYFTVKMR